MSASEAGGVAVALAHIRVPLGAILIQIPPVSMNVPLVPVDLALLRAPAAIPLLGASEVAVFNGAVFPHLIVIALGAVVGELALVLPQIALAGVDIAIIAPDIAIVSLNLMQLLRLGFGGSRSRVGGSGGEGRYGCDRNGGKLHGISLSSRKLYKQCNGAFLNGFRTGFSSAIHLFHKEDNKFLSEIALPGILPRWFKLDFVRMMALSTLDSLDCGFSLWICILVRHGLASGAAW